MQKYVTIYKILIVMLVVSIVTVCVSYRIGISPVSKDSKEVTIEIAENSTYLSIASQLKENHLIRSQSFYKIYIRIFKPNHLQAGTYILNENMGVKKIVDTLEGNQAVLNIASFVIPEGKHIEDVASILSDKTGHSKEEWMNLWDSQEFVQKAIDKYWFVTEEVNNKNLRHSLEGYFFPATYEFLKSSTMEEITYKMLDKMGEVLSKYKEVINDSSYTVHQILTLSSIVEYEAVLDVDRPKIAKVFLNRLDSNMMLQSCATVGYAINEWKLSYTNRDLQTDSPYNTYKYQGLPVGPGGLPGEASIKAVLYPDNHSYYYFLANVYDENDKQTYYSKTYSEHQQNCWKYLGRAC